ncbi:MAG: COX15/CtaA family protein [Telmatospirillum sp.]|nr:COX15/CtaA family protein [Telmatospirillum sp.]
MVDIAAPAPAALPHAHAQTADRAIATWLFVCCAMIFAMVVIGGITRLTESGLSIVEWRPVSGVLPPLSEAAWLAEFEKYRQIDQYRLMNAGMSLEAFKTIYFWEWFHRFWGRLIGIVFAVPFFWFVLRGQLRGRRAVKLFALFCLGGLQGLIGWWMVSSGLKPDMLAVSQYRLAAHLSLALALYLGLLWTALGIRMGPSRGTAAGLAVLALVFTTAMAGAFVAGLDAGLAYNTFPLMDGAFVPVGYGDIAPFWKNLFENHAAVQFNHRWLGIASLVAVSLLAWRLFQAVPRAAIAMALAGAAQVALGIATLLLWVPIPLAAAHQAGSVVLLTAVAVTVHAAGLKQAQRKE